jgi:AraC-like DNA-binding protein
MARRTYSRKIHLFPVDRPRWLDPHPEGRALQYLAWGDRFFGRDPVPVYLHEGWSYTVILQGSPILLLGSERIRLKAGEAVLIGPDCPMGWGGDSPRTCTKVLGWSWLGAPFFLQGDNARDRWHRLSLSREAVRRLQAVHSRCREEVERADLATGAALDGLRATIDVELCRQLKMKQTMTDSTLRFQLAVRWMEQHVNAAAPMRLLGEYLQISPATLKGLFRDRAGVSPQAYFQKLKFERARKMLVEKKMPVKAVAFELGYRHANDFSRAFRLFAGRSPRDAARAGRKSEIARAL